MSYGYCPNCDHARIVSRTRGIPSMDQCENGHKQDAKLLKYMQTTPETKQ